MKFQTARPVAGITVYQPGKPIEEVERELGIRGSIKLASN
ncbi:MAG: histidinol-phosphate transaminase, partial [Candidatus Tectomicrobia bacterium]|nr:histidinol-phosphate transaminase [Candidatus Tectomicrobia bacterium]